MPVHATNPLLHAQVENHGDFLYHFGMGTMTHDLPEMFGQIRFVLMGGSASRMEKMANLLHNELGLKKGEEIVDLAKAGGRYSMYKVGQVLLVNHNIGASTLSVVLHEIFKLLEHAGVDRSSVHVIRLGTSGGLGVEPGTVVIANGAIDALKRDHFHSAECGKMVPIPCKLDLSASALLKTVADEIGMPAVQGKTMGTDDFYLGQGRLDGAFLSYGLRDKMDFLKDVHDNYGVKNIEMEAHILSAFTHRAGLKCSIVCVTLLDRLMGDQVTTPKAILKEFEQRPLRLVAEFIRRAIN